MTRNGISYLAKATSIAYIDFEKQEDAEKAKSQLNMSVIQDNIIRIDFFDREHQ